MTKILITGGAGFIGYHLASRLSKDRDSEILLVDNFARGQSDSELDILLAKPNVSILNADLTKAPTYERVGRDYDEVYHLAGLVGVRNVIAQPKEVLRINLISTLLILDWFTNGGGMKFLFSSTSEVYAWTQQFHELPIPTPEDIPLSLTELVDPRSTYAASKMVSELAVIHYCQAHDKPFAILRYHNIYGPRMGNEHVIPELYHRAFGGENPLAVYSAKHSRAFCYVADAVEGTMLAMRGRSAIGQTINIGNDLEEVTIRELASLLLQTAKIHAEVEPREAPDDPIVRRCPDISRARDLLGYEPQVTLATGLEKTLAWYRQSLRSERSGSVLPM